MVKHARSDKERKAMFAQMNKPHTKKTPYGHQVHPSPKAKQKYVLYGTSNGTKKKFGTYNSQKEADTAQGLHAIELQNSGYEDNVEWTVENKKH